MISLSASVSLGTLNNSNIILFSVYKMVTKSVKCGNVAQVGTHKSLAKWFCSSIDTIMFIASEHQSI